MPSRKPFCGFSERLLRKSSETLSVLISSTVSGRHTGLLFVGAFLPLSASRGCFRFDSTPSPDSLVSLLISSLASSRISFSCFPPRLLLPGSAGLFSVHISYTCLPTPRDYQVLSSSCLPIRHIACRFLAIQCIKLFALTLAYGASRTSFQYNRLIIPSSGHKIHWLKQQKSAHIGKPYPNP